MTVGSISQREVDVIEEGRSVREAAQRMRQRGVGTLVIQDQAGKPGGIVTDRDLVLRVLAAGKDPHSTPVGEVASSEPQTVPEDAPLETALNLLRKTRCRRLPVVNRAGRLVGIVSLDDLVGALSTQLWEVREILRAQAPENV